VRPGRISTITAISVMVAGAFIGMAGAGPASAAGYSNLCVNGPSGIGTQCIDSELGTGSSWVITLPWGTASLTNWVYPTGSTPEYIQQADGVNYCLQVDEAGLQPTVGDYDVIGSKCVGDTAEEWVNVYDSTAKRTLFESVWGEGAPAYQAMCLAFNNIQGSGLMIEPCHFSGASSEYWEQQWGTS
jgi:hypothetical protein